MGWETSTLGYPVSDEKVYVSFYFILVLLCFVLIFLSSVPEGRKSDFQGGSLVWQSASGEVWFLYGPNP